MVQKAAVRVRYLDDAVVTTYLTVLRALLRT